MRPNYKYRPQASDYSSRFGHRRAAITFSARMGPTRPNDSGMPRGNTFSRKILPPVKARNSAVRKMFLASASRRFT